MTTHKEFQTLYLNEWKKYVDRKDNKEQLIKIVEIKIVNGVRISTTFSNGFVEYHRQDEDGDYLARVMSSCTLTGSIRAYLNIDMSPELILLGNKWVANEVSGPIYYFPEVDAIVDKLWKCG